MIGSTRIEGEDEETPFIETKTMVDIEIEIVRDRTVATIRMTTMIRIATRVIMTEFIATTIVGGVPLIPGIIIVGVDPGTSQVTETITMIMTITRMAITERNSATK